jgi:hypothetical protein
MAASPEQELADKYAPVAALVDQKKPCEKGEAWRPTTVDIVLGNPDVQLRGPGKGNPVVMQGPTAADLFRKGKGYYLNFPGNPLRPGCRYDRDGKRFAEGRPSIAYAHIVAEPGDPRRFSDPGRLALQYWFFYYFNDFNDKHEADWEGIQLVFEADSASAALRTEPTEVGYAQHGGGEKAGWDSTKLEKVGTHPVIYSAAGSHATYYSTALWLGTSASEGFGCDDTRAPTHQVPLGAVLVPTTVHSRVDPDAWITFEGRWGQKERGANNGPTGPNTKSRWTDPFDWQENLRDDSIEVPAGETVGQSVTGAFCAVVEFLSSILNYFYESPPLTILGLTVVAALCLGLIALLLWRTSWRPGSVEPVRARRNGGQILGASARIYWRRKWVLLGVGLLSFVVTAFVQLLNELLAWAFSPFGDVSISLSSTAFAALFINAGVAIVVHHLASGRRIGVLSVYRLVFTRGLILIGAVLLEILVIVLVVLAVGAIPWLASALADELGIAVIIILVLIAIPPLLHAVVGWLFTAQEIYVDRCSAVAAVIGGPKLVRHNWWRSAVLLGLLYLLALVSGPLIGFILLFRTSVGPETLNLVGSAVYVLVFPYVAIATTLLYYDLQERRRETLEPAPGPEVVAASAV